MQWFVFCFLLPLWGHLMRQQPWITPAHPHFHFHSLPHSYDSWDRMETNLREQQEQCQQQPKGHQSVGNRRQLHKDLLSYAIYMCMQNCFAIAAAAILAVLFLSLSSVHHPLATTRTGCMRIRLVGDGGGGGVPCCKKSAHQLFILNILPSIRLLSFAIQG